MQKHELSDKIVVIDDICYKTVWLSFIIFRASLIPFVYIFGKPVEFEDSEDLSVFGAVTWVMKYVGNEKENLNDSAYWL